MIRKLILALAVGTLLALFIAPSVANASSDLADNFVSGTSTRGIVLDGDIHWVLVHPRAENVVVEMWNSGSKQYEFTVLADYAWVFQTSGMDSCRVVRASATIVDYGMSTIKQCAPSLTTKYTP